MKQVAQNELQLWLAYPADTAMCNGVPAGMYLLSPDEQERLHAFRFDKHRREYGTARALLRTALSSNLPVRPEDWRFNTNAFGKPAIDAAYGVQFNLSNCPELAVCLLARGADVGVDAEPYKRAEQILALASDVFSPQEKAQLDALPQVERAKRALSLWTLKEAYTKARGMGLSLPLQQFSFLFDGKDVIRLEFEPGLEDRAERWRFCLIDHASHRIALVAEQTAPARLDLWEVRPAYGAPHQLSPNSAPWFPAL